MARFRDREDAGARLAGLVEPLVAGDDAVILGVPRGGVVVGRALADALGLAFDVLVVRKLGVPGNPEFGFGAIGEARAVVIDQATVAALGLSNDVVRAVESRERRELDHRVELYRKVRAPIEIAGRTVVLVDDGIATGGTVRAALAVCRARGAAKVVVAAGVAPPEIITSLAHEADAAVAVIVPATMRSVGEWYADFAQTDHSEVLDALRR